MFPFSSDLVNEICWCTSSIYLKGKCLYLLVRRLAFVVAFSRRLFFSFMMIISVGTSWIATPLNEDRISNKGGAPTTVGRRCEWKRYQPKESGFGEKNCASSVRDGLQTSHGKHTTTKLCENAWRHSSHGRWYLPADDRTRIVHRNIFLFFRSSTTFSATLSA